MATALTIANRAARILGKLASGASLSTNERADALTAINALLGRWRNDRLLCFALQEETVSLTSGAATKTLGPSGDLVTTRPVDIVRAWIVDANNNSIAVKIIEEPEYAALVNKTASGNWPTKILYRPSMPNGTIVTWPVANASGTLKVLTRVPLLEFTAIDDTVTLPPGWEDALAFNLAVVLAPEYEVPVTPDVELQARATKAAIKTIDNRPLRRRGALRGLMRRSYADINSFPAQ